ncbi:MAG: hypothetical protein ACRCTY_04655, partial [Candidatus Adiutrix sp.]
MKVAVPQAVYMTSGLNATNRNMVIISGGAWNGIIFPAVLKPSQSIHSGYSSLIKKYGAVGLSESYQTYLGMAQGQVLARALRLASTQETNPLPFDLAQGLYRLGDFDTLFYAPLKYEPNKHQPKMFYLAEAYGNGYWQGVPAPTSVENEGDGNPNLIDEQ